MYSALEGRSIGLAVGFEELVELAAHFGFGGVYLDLDYLDETGPETVVQMAEERHLKLAGWNLPVSLLAEQARFADQLERLRDTSEACARAAAWRCTTWIPPASDRMPYPEMFALMRERVQAVADILAENGIRLGIEFVAPKTIRAKHKYEFIHTLEGALELCQAVAGAELGLVLDTFHLYTSGADPERLLELTDRQIISVHVNDAPAGVDPDKQIDNVRCLPGETGVIDARRYLECLQQVGYTGPVMVEPFTNRLDKMSPEDAVRLTKEALDGVWPD